MQNFNSAELRPVEFARAYLQKKMLKKPLRKDAGEDVLPTAQAQRTPPDSP